MENDNTCSNMGNLGKIKGVIFLTDKQLRDIRIRARDYRLIVGIDPGKVTGFATWLKPDKKLLSVDSYPIHKAIKAIDFFIQTYGKKNILIRIEDARQRKWLPAEKSNSEYRGRLQGAGSVKRDCQIWEDFLKETGIDYEFLPPAAGRTKWKEDYFKTVTKYEGRTSEHGRDAAALIFGL